MKFEIKLTEVERYVLKNTMGFSEKIPALLGPRYLEENRESIDTTKIEELPIVLRGLRAKMLELDGSYSEIFIQQTAIWRKYKEIFIAEKGKTKNRAQAVLNTQEIMNQEDKSKLESLAVECSTLSNHFDLLNNSINKIHARSTYKLHGIIGIVQGDARYHKYFYKNCVVPNENFTAVQQAVKEGEFKKTIEQDDVRLLSFLWDRTKDIKKRSWRGHAPRFSLPQIMLELGIKDRNYIESSLLRLTGLLCHTYGPDCGIYTLESIPTAIYNNCWFIPMRRHNIIGEILE
ncbi:hypothetical protein HYW75_05855 [Candidatus Pacearchaeota archaeon]|nr:hypothetical protein [Candidatus Pacearchaeota archaeon]